MPSQFALGARIAGCPDLDDDPLRLRREDAIEDQESSQQRKSIETRLDRHPDDRSQTRTLLGRSFQQPPAEAGRRDRRGCYPGRARSKIRRAPRRTRRRSPFSMPPGPVGSRFRLRTAGASAARRPAIRRHSWCFSSTNRGRSGGSRLWKDGDPRRPFRGRDSMRARDVVPQGSSQSPKVRQTGDRPRAAIEGFADRRLLESADSDNSERLKFATGVEGAPPDRYDKINTEGRVIRPTRVGLPTHSARSCDSNRSQ